MQTNRGQMLQNQHLAFRVRRQLHRHRNSHLVQRRRRQRQRRRRQNLGNLRQQLVMQLLVPAEVDLSSAHRRRRHRLLPQLRRQLRCLARQMRLPHLWLRRLYLELRPRLHRTHQTAECSNRASRSALRQLSRKMRRALEPSPVHRRVAHLLSEGDNLAFNSARRRHSPPEPSRLARARSRSLRRSRSECKHHPLLHQRLGARAA